MLPDSLRPRGPNGYKESRPVLPVDKNLKGSLVLLSRMARLRCAPIALIREMLCLSIDQNAAPNGIFLRNSRRLV